MRTRLALGVAAVLAFAACGSEPDEGSRGGDSAEDGDGAAPSAEGIPFPGGGAGSYGTAEEHCSDDPETADQTGVEMAFVATVRAVEGLDDGTDWVTFDVEQWFTDDVGTELALFTSTWDGVTGERWLVAASRYSVQGLTSGDLFPCASEVFSTTGLAEWELRLGAPIDAGVGRPERPADPELLTAIATARARWQAASPSAYTYTVHVHDRADWSTEPASRCGLGPVRVVVDEDVVTQARDLWAHCDVAAIEVATIDVLFGLMAEYAGASGSVPTFDTEYGYPQSFEARDRSVEVTIWFSEFVPRAVPVTVGPIDAVVADARAVWEAAAVTSYRAVVEVVCFCDVPGRFDVTVQDGVVTSATPESLSWIEPSVDGLFDHVEATRLDDDGAELAFDGELGYPVALRFDGEEMTADDELELYVHELTPLP